MGWRTKAGGDKKKTAGYGGSKRHQDAGIIAEEDRKTAGALGRKENPFYHK